MIDQNGVHAAHCCATHGCKYGDNTCPVYRNSVIQMYPCEFCEDDEISVPCEYLRMIENDAKLLNCLRAFGVCDWDGYAAALDMYKRVESK